MIGVEFIVTEGLRFDIFLEVFMWNKRWICVLAFAALATGVAACSDGDSEEKGGVEAGCSYTAPKCNDAGTALLTCVNGKEESKACRCQDGKCESTPQAKCDFTGSRCRADGTGLETCTNGALSFEACSCQDGKCETDPKPDTPIEDKCTFTEPKCSDDGGAKLTCVGGKLETKECVCKDGKCEDEVIAECQASDAATCIENGTMRQYCDPATLLLLTESCECYEGECVDEACSYSGNRCASDGKTVKTCKNKAEETVEVCVGACADGACLDKACPSETAKSCFDMKTALVCKDGKMVKESCSGDLICADGVCSSSSSEEKCTLTAPKCDDTNSGILSCDGDKSAFELCEFGSYCAADESGNVQCVKAETCENFSPYCFEEDGKTYAMQCGEDPAGKPYRKECGASCNNGVCEVNREVGADCNPSAEHWAGTMCSGNRIIECNIKTKKVTLVSDCAADGDICGIEYDESTDLKTPRCMESCSTLEQVVNVCVPYGMFGGDKPQYSAIQQKCVYVDNGIGDKRMAYVDISSYEDGKCDIDCKEGKCIDYTAGIEDVGKECVEASFTERCDSGRAIKCEDGVVTVVQCDYDEVCYFNANDDAAKTDFVTCAEVCKKGDAPRYSCMLNLATKKECVADKNGVYAYATTSDMETCKNACVEGTGCK